ncbi:hypothetical protein MMC26_006994 [Xylographa opegraphella]|nr:hypothetical protein [Xylographa opegraphella]
MTSKAFSSGPRLSIALLPTLLSLLYFRWNNLPTLLDKSNIRVTDSSLDHGPSPNIDSVSAFDLLYEQYAKVCPEHSYKTRIFSTDPLIIYLENYITVPEREYIVKMTENRYTQSQVAEVISHDRVGVRIPDYRSSQTAPFYEDPVSQCIEERSAAFQGNIPVDRLEAIQVVKYTAGDQYRHHWDWWEGADNPRISTFFVYLACDSGESGNSGHCEGGATHFPELKKDFHPGWCDVIDCYDDSGLGGVAFKPVVGNAIFWSNVHPNSTYHQGTFHAGMPLKKGQKVGLNIWTHRDEVLDTGLTDGNEVNMIVENDKIAWVKEIAEAAEAERMAEGQRIAEEAKSSASLYRGYKNRNARLDTLNAIAPKYLLESPIALANQNFTDVESEELLNELQKHLYLRYQLLDRVIRARKLHRSHFFSLSLDYGHQHFLDVLQSQKYITLRALERLTRRIGDVKYMKQKWFKWVRECQVEEETHRDNESKRIKREAALFKRHAKVMESRRRALRAKEEKQRQEEYLDKAYNERKLQEEINLEGSWDPIEEVVENDRGDIVELIKHFLWEESLAAGNSKPPSGDVSSGVVANGSKLSSESPTMVSDETAVSSMAVKASKATKASRKAKAKNEKSDEVPTNISETRAHMRQRLKEGTEINYEPHALRVQGLIVNPELLKKSPPIPDNEIEHLLEEVLLLSHAALFPATLRADSVEAFLDDEQISIADLRDLCIKMEKPDLQDIRDACADLSRKDEEENNEELLPENQVGNEQDEPRPRSFFKPKPGALPATWKPEREMGLETMQQRGDSHPNMENEDEGKVIDFGAIDNEAQYQRKKMVVKVCGRKIHNYRSERAMSHAGWFHFSIIARDSDLYDAIRLCRHWDEFFELNILAIFLYFPASNWLSWVGDHFRSQLLQLGFITYFEFTEADEISVHQQSGSRGGGRSTHAIFEAHKPNIDLSSRRKTGRIISKPPQEDLWLLREKSGIGRAAKNEWNVIKQIGPDFFKEMEDHRRWHFGFVEHYDLYIWDNAAGGKYSDLYNTIQGLLVKAYRSCKGPDFYNLAAPVLKTITRDKESQRVRKIKPGEDVVGLYDEIQMKERNVTRTDAQQPKNLFYDEADALEDQVLFPEEFGDNQSKESDDANDLDEQRKSDSKSGSLVSIEESLSGGASGSESDDSDTDVIVPRGHKKEDDHYDVEEDFWYWFEKEKAKALKSMFHAADLESGANERYTETNTTIKKMQRYNAPGEIRLLHCLNILEWMGQRPEKKVQSRMIHDMRKAYAMMSLFFPTGFFESNSGLQFKDSLLFNQSERMRRLPPDRRTHHSNVCMPKQLWAEWDTFHTEEEVHKYPFDWDLTIRPIIARLFKEGLLTTSRYEGAAGYAIAAQEPGRKADLYCDYRLNIGAIHMTDLRLITTETLRNRAREYNKNNPQARFALLKLWSAAHFYPFMLLGSTRWQWSFRDCIGRTWEWKLIPKDMPYSEWSVHRNCKERLEPFMRVFKGRVVVKRDLFLVMGEDEKDLQKMATAVTFAIQTRPWRLEVDLWKSFVNVDLKFLEEMDDKWLE